MTPEPKSAPATHSPQPRHASLGITSRRSHVAKGLAKSAPIPETRHKMTAETISDVQVAPEATPIDSSTAARNRLVIALLLVSTFVVFLNETIMSVAIPHLMDRSRRHRQRRAVADHGFPPDHGGCHSDHRLPAAAHQYPADLHARHVDLFASGTLICAVSPGLELLVFGRVIQAVGTAIMMPLLMTTVMTLVPPEASRQDHGQHLHRHVGRAGYRPDHFGGLSSPISTGAGCSSSCCRSRSSRWPWAPAT